MCYFECLSGCALVLTILTCPENGPWWWTFRWSCPLIIMTCVCSEMEGRQISIDWIQSCCSLVFLCFVCRRELLTCSGADVEQVSGTFGCWRCRWLLCASGLFERTPTIRFSAFVNRWSSRSRLGWWSLASCLARLASSIGQRHVSFRWLCSKGRLQALR